MPDNKPDAAKLELRFVTFEKDEKIECRAEDKKPIRLAGYAAKFNKTTNLGWFTERIKPGAFDEALKSSDCRCLKNHNPDLILGRESSGTLRLATNSVGLQFECDVPDTTTGRDTLEEVRRGDIAGCSFAFTVAEDEWKNNEEEGTTERTIVRVGELFDVGPVTYPAYQDTTVAARSLEAFNVQGKGNVVPTVPPAPSSATPEQLAASKRLFESVSRKVSRQHRSESPTPAPGRSPHVDPANDPKSTAGTPPAK